MPRRRAQAWQEPGWATWLAYWLRVEPRVRHAVIERAESLHDQLEPGRRYPNAYVQFRLTRKRREDELPGVVDASAARADLRLLIDRLSHASPRPPDPTREQALLAEWAERLDVSTRTLDRWRGRGLRWRWVLPEKTGSAGGKVQPKLALDAAAVELFRAEQPGVVERAGAFTRMTESERAAAVAAMRSALAERPGGSPRAALEAASAETGRSVETLRQVAERHDDSAERGGAGETSGPAGALFPRRPAVTRADRRAWHRAVRAGRRVAEVAEAAGQPVAVVRRGILRRRARAALRVPLVWVLSPLFERDDAAAVFLRVLPPPPAVDASRRALGVLPEPLRDLFAAGAEDPHLASRFRQWNFLKFDAERQRAPWRLPGGRPTAAGLDRFRETLHQAADVRAQLWRAGLPVVLNVARRSRPASDGQHHVLHRMLISGAGVVARALPEFDADREVEWEVFLRPRLSRTLALIAAEPPQAAPRRTPEALRRRVLIAGRVGRRLDEGSTAR